MHHSHPPPTPPEAAAEAIDLPHQGPRQLVDQPSIRDAGVRLAAAARREILIFTHDLDAPLYDQAPFLGEVRRLALAQPHRPVRVLVFEPRRAVSDGHRLVELGRKLGSRIGMRRTAEEFRHRSDAFLVVDATGYCLRRLADRHEAQVDLAAPGPAARLRAEFEQMWELSSEDTELRRLTL